MKKALIIGSGVGGLATAIRLACKGYEVSVFESASGPGGKLNNLQIGSYRFDRGPSLFTMPGFVEDLFHLAGERPEDHFRYQRIPVSCNYFWEDGTFLRAFSEPDIFSLEVEKVLGVPAKVTEDYLNRSRSLYELTGHIFLDRSLHRTKSWLRSDVVRAFLNLPLRALRHSLNDYNERTLKNAKLVQLFNRYATYNGSDPYQAPAMLSVIPHFEFNVGTFLPEGGMYDITKALYGLAVRKGVQFHFETEVDEIIVQGKTARGIRISEHEHYADVIVSNMDITPTYRRLLKKMPAPESTLAQPGSSSALIFYWGITKSFERLHLHNIFFSDNYAAEFDSIFRKGEIYHDPTVYVSITSKYVEKDAPPGGENWFILLNAPPHDGRDWDERVKAARQNLIQKVSRHLGTDIGPLIEEEQVWTPAQIQLDTSSHRGSLYGTSSNNRMAAFLRHPNFSRQLRNLYFCGGSVHPGGGIPLCLQSARIVSELIPKA